MNLLLCIVHFCGFFKKSSTQSHAICAFQVYVLVDAKGVLCVTIQV